jgi:hypothetical protein
MKSIIINDETIHAVEHFEFDVPVEGISIYHPHSFQDILIVSKSELLLNWQVNHGEEFETGLLYQPADHMKEIGDIKVNIFSMKPIGLKGDEVAHVWLTVQRN